MDPHTTLAASLATSSTSFILKFTSLFILGRESGKNHFKLVCLLRPVRSGRLSSSSSKRYVCPPVCCPPVRVLTSFPISSNVLYIFLITEYIFVNITHELHARLNDTREKTKHHSNIYRTNSASGNRTPTAALHSTAKRNAPVQSSVVVSTLNGTKKYASRSSKTPRTSSPVSPPSHRPVVWAARVAAARLHLPHRRK